MYYESQATYHIFNRSNELLFYNRENYLFFLKKIRKHILHYADILAYCLMPNHFHLLVRLKDEAVATVRFKGKEEVQQFSFSIGQMLSSYTQAINKQIGRKGYLFAHNTKAKMLNDVGNDYLLSCFLYIHQNPLQAGLVNKVEDWEYSSYLDYVGLRNGTLVNTKEGLDMLQISAEQVKYLIDKFIQDKEDIDFL
ncbi:MAG: transposase [Petrimonas sp.]|jgi:REP element-mobilizing transposase RayT